MKMVMRKDREKDDGGRFEPFGDVRESLVGKLNVLFRNSERVILQSGPQEEVVEWDVVCDVLVVGVAGSVFVDFPERISPD